MVTLRRFVVFAPAAFAALVFLAVVLAEGGLAEPGWSVSALSSGLTGACLVLSLVGGLVPKRSDVRRHASAVLAVFAMTALGQSRMVEVPNAIYRTGVVLFVLLLIASWRAPQHAATREAERRPVATRGRGPATAVLGVVWLVIAATLVLQLPPASQAVERRVTRYFEGYHVPDPVVGFSSSLSLGSTRDMLKSSKIVMRIDGPPVDYLRGAVLDEYDFIHARWSGSLDELRTKQDARLDERGDDRTVIRLARGAPLARGAEARWFLPADACDLHTRSGDVDLDLTGVAHPRAQASYDAISFRSGSACGGSAHGLPAPAPPGPLDSALDPRLARQLARASRAWTSPGQSDHAKLEAFTRELGRYGYSLEVERKPGLDPAVDLLYVHREGHCELFASALALLARTQGIPSRVVSGYRVTERSTFTGHAVVRERNAHTWVEAWVGDHWESFDPTPAVERDAAASTTRWERVSETVGWAFERTIDFFWNIGLVNAGIGGVVLVVVLLFIRRLTQRVAKGDDGALVTFERPLPAFEQLTASLARAGWVREASEPLEGFASRLGAADEPWSREAAEAIARYAQLRYGGLGEERQVVDRLTTLVDRLRQPLRAS